MLSGGILATSTLAGRLTSRVPVRMLIGPGLLLVGVGLLLMRGLGASTSWTHLIRGLIIAGVGTGLVNPPLASTAVGVVPPQQTGMASRINSTFRQVGIALLGTMFASKISAEVLARTTGVPGLAGKEPQIAHGLQSGDVAQDLRSLPPGVRGTVASISKASFTSGLDRILLVAAVLALVSGVLTFVLIRTKDFVQHPAR